MSATLAGFGSPAEESFLSYCCSTTKAHARVCVGGSTRWSKPISSSGPMAATWSEMPLRGPRRNDGHCGTMGAMPMTSRAHRVWCRSCRPQADTWLSSSRRLRGIGPRHECLLAVGRGGFGQHVAWGAQDAAARLGMSVVGCVTHDEVADTPDVDALLLAGTFAQDVALVRRLRKRPPIIGAVAAGLDAFAAELGRRAEGVLAPSQWEEGVHFAVDVGPRPAAVVRALRARVLPTLERGVRHEPRRVPERTGLRGRAGGDAICARRRVL